ncbi:hypothetical protein TCA2_4436 [Paenibacillus sp. TCA20]|uniref:DUF1257 domain-containing protein n=1 Tax=Paenibacillus sp. TCA20 TaxID=1499968 RepID=UPI0004D41FA1|nr:DUF1257 domain-containing protein [Paenibacillus sp. TCA20]GAK41944.1 hypothetical protein TCA2_4436 [Paenibacillus sp. TCA20]
MSHFQAYKCEVNNVEFVKKALTEMGLGYKENTTIIDYYKQSRNVVLAVVDTNGKLQPIGFQENAVDGKTKLECVADWFMTGFSEKQFTNQVAQLHDKYMVIDMCESNGFSVDFESITHSDAGELELVASTWS